MMKRRQFGAALTSSFAPAAVAAQQQNTRRPRKNSEMHVGGDYHSVAGGPGADITGKANLEYNLRHGIKHLTTQVRANAADGAWDLDGLKRMRDNCDKLGVVFEAIRMDAEYINLPKGADRDVVFQKMRKANIGVNVHYIPVYRHSYYQQHHPASPSDFPVTEDVFRRLITLPLFSKMNEEDVDDVVEALKTALQ